MPTILDDSSPADFRMPAKFTQFREIQRQIADFAVYGPPGAEIRKFHLIGAPGGCGKSLTSHVVGLLTGSKYAVLTATRSLEDQQVGDGFTDGPDCVHIRGRANYTCRYKDTREPDRVWNCEEGAEDGVCDVVGTGRCRYTAQVKLAEEANSGILTNYMYWMSVRAMNKSALETKGVPGRPIKTLILDEFHKAVNELARFLGIWVGNHQLKSYGGNQLQFCLKLSAGAEWGRVDEQWAQLLSQVSAGAEAERLRILEYYESEREAMQDRKYREAAKLVAACRKVLFHCTDKNWIWRHTKAGIAFDCVWPGRYANQYLWSGVERVIALSATNRPKAAHLLRIPSKDYWFREWPRVFPAQFAPVWWVPTTKLSKKTGEEELRRSVERLDQIVDKWQGYKGIVHTASYKRAEEFQRLSRYGRAMFINKSGTQVETAERFRAATGTALLVSPSYGTGWDFADESCRFQVIVKLPFPDLGDPVMRARGEEDKEYYSYETMQELQQECQRGQRHERDWCVTVITDDAVDRFRKYAREHAARWFNIRTWGGTEEVGRRKAGAGDLPGVPAGVERL